MPMGTERFAAVPAEHVEVLFATPNRAFKQIGIVSVVGSVTSSDVAIYKKFRKAAADLGADAVIVPDILPIAYEFVQGLDEGLEPRR